MEGDIERLPETFVQPWHFVREEIVLELETHRPKNTTSRLAAKSDEDVQNSTMDVRVIHDEYIPTSTVLPHGFFLVRTLHSTRPTLRNVLFAQYCNIDFLMTLDSHAVSVWRGNSKIMSLPTHVGEKKDGKKQSTVAGVSKWIYIPSWRNVVISNMQMELKVCSLLTFAQRGLICRFWISR
jgi:hypothetical protein